METAYRGLPEFIVKTDNIEHISNRACDNLKLGDEVIFVNGDEQKKFIVSSKSLEEMKLAFITSKEVTEVIYKKADDRWSYDKTETTTLASFPSMTGKGGKFAQVKADGSGIEYSDVSSLDLLATANIYMNEEENNRIEWSEILSPEQVAKITPKTILIFTYANCFVMGMLSQTGEGRVVGNLVYDNNGNSFGGKVKFTLNSNGFLKIETDVRGNFNSSQLPIGYLFAFSIK